MEDIQVAEPVTVEPVQQAEPASQSEPSSQPGFDALQSRMSDGYFMDDGLGAVVNENGEPLLDGNGNQFKSVADYEASKTQNANNQNQVQNTAQQNQNSPSVFSQGNQPDPNSVLGYIPDFSKVSYQSATMPQQQQAQVQAQSQQHQHQAVQKTPIEEISEYENSLISERLAPLKAEWEQIQSMLPREQAEAIFALYDKKYEAAQAEVKRLVRAKEFEIFDRSAKTNNESANREVLLRDSRAVVRSVANELFKNGGESAFWELVSGKEVTDAQGRKSFQRGVGADIVDMLFDQANTGKTFRSQEEWNSAYQNFWLNFSTNPNNVRAVAKIALGLFLVNNQNSMREGYRQAFANERQPNNRMSSTPQPNAHRQAAVSSGEQMDPSLASWLGKPVSRV